MNGTKKLTKKIDVNRNFSLCILGRLKIQQMDHTLIIKVRYLRINTLFLFKSESNCCQVSLRNGNVPWQLVSHDLRTNWLFFKSGIPASSNFDPPQECLKAPKLFVKWNEIVVDKFNFLLSGILKDWFSFVIWFDLICGVSVYFTFLE